jgi:hypothetical protein
MNSLTVQSPPTTSYPSSNTESRRTSLDSESKSDLKTNEKSPLSGQSLEPEQQRELQELKKRDREVRAHELAHVSAGGRYVRSGAQLQYEKGPDGRLYAVGGEVSIDTSAIPGDPRATLLKAQVVIRAALAPASPSSQDRRVAAEATQMAQQARLELSLERTSGEEESVSQVDVFA